MDIRNAAAVGGAFRSCIAGSIGIACRVARCVTGCIGLAGRVCHTGSIWPGRVAGLWLTRSFVGHHVARPVVGSGIRCSVTRLLSAA